ncbi:site-specific integrase [Phaeospirillum tilakii]|uniref:site-specific integrase n=1 Tax=Phaeospirillum tilakii TaxID=741673 RepID=UPI00366B8F15
MNLPYVDRICDRRGVERFYYRRGGIRQRIPGAPDDAEFHAAYRAIHASFEAGGTVSAEVPGTFGHLVAAYYAASEFAQLKASTKSEYRRYLDGVRKVWGRLPVAKINRGAVKAFRDKLADRPATANAALRVVKTLFAFGVDACLVQENPAKGIRALKTSREGWMPWPPEVLEKFAAESTGAARTAFFLALYTGQRRGDVLAMRWDAIADGKIAVVQAKTGAALRVPLRPALVAELDRLAEERGGREGTIVQKADGSAYTDDGFGTIWNREQHRLGCKWPFHGLRKCATQVLFEAGCTPQEVQAITGHATLQMVQHYGQGANQARLAEAAMRKVDGGS